MYIFQGICNAFLEIALKRYNVFFFCNENLTRIHIRHRHIKLCVLCTIKWCVLNYFFSGKFTIRGRNEYCDNSIVIREIMYIPHESMRLANVFLVFLRVHTHSTAEYIFEICFVVKKKLNKIQMIVLTFIFIFG